MQADVHGTFRAGPVQVRPLAELIPEKRRSVGTQLAELLVSGSVEEQRYTPENAVLIEMGCRDLQADLLEGAPGWFVAWHNATPVGLVRLASAGSSMPDAGVLAGLFVAPEWRRRGVGRCLVLAAMAAARAQHLKRVILYVAKASPARLFYKELGMGEGTPADETGFIRIEWPLTGELPLPVRAGAVQKEAHTMIDRKMGLFVLRAVAVAMGITVIVLGILQPTQVQRMVILLGVGLAALAISTLNE